ncbi:hypothetical protein BGZ98_010073 [Dissophora globulifera]|nr:hypothetical protein BGZ98_010073 [Dissophora globulifera]
MMPPMAVSDYNATMTKNLYYRPVAPLSEANLSKHTLHMSPVSRQAKLNNLIGFVDKQRELVSSEDDDEVHKATIEKSAKRITRSGPVVLVPNNDLAREEGQPPRQLRSPYRPHRNSYRESVIPDGLNPNLALPRALPRRFKPTRPDTELYRDSIYTEEGFGQDNQNVDEMHLGSSNSPNGVATTVRDDWRQDMQMRFLQQRTQEKRMNAVDDFELHRRPLVRQPTTASMERVKKLGGRIGGLVFPNKGRRGANLRRNNSFNAPTTRSEESLDSADRTAFTYRSGRAMNAATTALGTSSSETQSEDMAIIKPKGTVKQLFMDVFRKSNRNMISTTKSDIDDEPQYQDETYFESKNKFAVWSQAIELEDVSRESSGSGSGSEISPFTARDPWTPETTSKALRNSVSFNQMFNVDFRRDVEADFHDDIEDEGDNESEASLRSAQRMPIAALINSLAAFGLDYVSHNPYASQQRMVALEQE